jgi:enoyl-CoA hydratase
MDFECLILEKKDNVGIITFNRPQVMNALDMKLFSELKVVVEEVEEDKEIRAVVITGSGKAFCSGIDITILSSFAQMSTFEIREFIRSTQRTLNSLEDMEKPVIAAVNGYALGGGCDIALACDIRIASESASFGELYVRLGLVPDMGGTQRLAKLVGPGKAKELIFTGDRIDAYEARRIGLVERVAAEDKFQDEVMELAKGLAQGPTVAIGLAKIAINRGLGMDVKAGLEYEAYAQTICLKTEDVTEGATAFKEKRKPQFKGR